MRASVIRDIYHSFSFMLDEVEITEVTPKELTVIFTLKGEKFRTVFEGNGVSYTSRINGEEKRMRYEFNYGPKFIWELRNYFDL